MDLTRNNHFNWFSGFFGDLPARLIIYFISFILEHNSDLMIFHNHYIEDCCHLSSVGSPFMDPLHFSFLASFFFFFNLLYICPVSLIFAFIFLIFDILIFDIWFLIFDIWYFWYFDIWFDIWFFWFDIKIWYFDIFLQVSELFILSHSFLLVIRLDYLSDPSSRTFILPLVISSLLLTLSSDFYFRYCTFLVSQFLSYYFS